MPESDGSIGAGPQVPGAGDGGSGGPGGGGAGGDGSRSVREGAGVLECRRRAEAAEARAAELEVRIGELEGALAASERALEQAQAAAATAERRREGERLLSEAQALDVETGLMLVESMLARGDCECPREAVERLRQDKAFLFAPATVEPAPARGGMSGMSAMGAPDAGVDRFLDELEDVASRARESGDRRELLRYLRLRRGAG